MEQKKQDIVFGTLLVVSPIIIAICGLLSRFNLVDLVYLISVVAIGIQYVINYRKNNR